MPALYPQAVLHFFFWFTKSERSGLHVSDLQMRRLRAPADGYAHTGDRNHLSWPSAPLYRLPDLRLLTFPQGHDLVDGESCKPVDMAARPEDFQLVDTLCFP